MKQVYLISLFLLRYCVVAAQNTAPVNGPWVSYYTNGNRCDSGFLNNNKPDGLWKSWHPNGQLKAQMQTSARKLSSTKEEMERLYRPGFSPGPNIKDMKQVQLGSTYPYDKMIYRQLYLSIHPPDISRSFTECMVHGLYQTWFENGISKDSGYCDNGVREGVWDEWDESMNMRGVGFYKNGLRWKDWRYFDKEGRLQFIKVYNRQEEVIETIALK